MHNDVLAGKLVLHRDLKPDNIAFKRDGTLKLIDLGMGKVTAAPALLFLLWYNIYVCVYVYMYVW